MCGIVGVASNNKVSSATLELFKSLLLHDVVRGHHATGVAAINTAKNEVGITKEAIPSYEFLEKYEINDDCNIYIGHNRWATRGAKDDDENAHPFSHGHITGVHNGSLRDQSLLDNHTDFEVDSDNLFHHLSRRGIEHTAKNLDGAFAIVYYDADDRTLNFMRNSERPLFVAKLSNGSICWASESQMMEWLVCRSKSLSFKMHEGKAMIYSLAEGVHYKISFSGFKMKEQVNTKRDLFTRDYSSGRSYNTPWEAKLNSAIKTVNSFADKTSWFEVKVLSQLPNRKIVEYTSPQGTKWKFVSYTQENLGSTAWVKITSTYEALNNPSDKEISNLNNMIYMAGTVSKDRPAGAVFTSGYVQRGQAKVVLANDKCSLDELREYRTENKEACSNCGSSMAKLWPASLYLLKHYDREAKETFHYLSCTEKCHTSMVEFVAEIENDYDQTLEGVCL